MTIESVLRAALANQRGWRERARDVLGLTKFGKCEMCQKKIKLGGRIKKYCSEKCLLGRPIEL